MHKGSDGPTPRDERDLHRIPVIPVGTAGAIGGSVAKEIGRDVWTKGKKIWGRVGGMIEASPSAKEIAGELAAAASNRFGKVIGAGALVSVLEERGCHLRLENPITLPPSHEPEPDGAVVRGGPADYLAHHPGPADVSCAIEVADSSLRSDRTIKQCIYAGAGIGQFILVNLVEGRIEVYEEPNVAERFYGVVRVLHRADSIPLRLPDGTTLSVPVADWLPETRPSTESPP